MGSAFSGKKYITRGVDSTIPLEIQLAMFSALTVMKNKAGELDYLQIFRLETIEKDGTLMLHICHEQENPEAKVDYLIPVSERIDTKVYIIDDVEYVTMLLAEEY